VFRLRWWFSIAFLLFQTNLLHVLLANVKADLPYAMFRSYGDYTTNLPLKDVMNTQAWIAFKYEGAALGPEHGGPRTPSSSSFLFVEEC
jgi:DMSO/TMAO reductase YedYZ molybdopterin-dependent catalytic subunit